MYTRYIKKLFFGIELFLWLFGLKLIRIYNVIRFVNFTRKKNDPIMPLDQNWLFNECVRVFCDPNATILLVYILAKMKMRKMIFFLPKSTSSVSPSQAHLAKRKCMDGQLALTLEPIEFCMASYQTLYAKFPSMMFPKCLIVETTVN